MGEVLGRGGRGTHRWRGGMRGSRKRRLSMAEARGGGGKGARSVAWGRAGGAGLVGRAVRSGWG
jgi:hypothetical protein